VRPAGIFILFAIIATELFMLIKKQTLKQFAKNIFVRTIPFVAGYFMAIFIQYMYSSSWTTLFDAQRYWENDAEHFHGVTDWSVEGFGLSSFAIFFICIPSLIFIIFLLLKRKSAVSHNSFIDFENYTKEHYLFLISLFYFISIFLFTLLTRKGNLHSLFRYTLSSPLFYTAILIFLNHTFNKKITLSFFCFVICAVFLKIFLSSVEYGGDRIVFSFAGLYLFILTFIFMMFRNKLKKPVLIALLILITFLNVIWNTYLLNSFLSNAWIFV